MTSHRRDLVSLFFGLVFTLCGVAFLDRSEDWDLFDSGGLLAFGLVAIGVLGVLLVLTGARSGRETVPEPTVPPVDGHPNGDDLDLPGFDDLDLPGFDGPDDQLDALDPDEPAEPVDPT